MLISVEQMAIELGSTKEGVYARMRRGQLPKPLRIGDTPYWRQEDWKEWLELQAVQQGVAVGGDSDSEPALQPAVRRRGRPRKQ